MFVELLSRTENPKLGLTVKIEVADLDFPKSSEQMSNVLTKHVLECRHCLAAVLFREETLAEAGCESYKRLLSKMRSALQLRASLNEECHVHEEILEEYCFNRLSPAEAERLERHFHSCAECDAKLQGRRAFIRYMKAALELQQCEELDEEIGGVMGIHCPDLELSVCVPIPV
jgi:hypothetical protein